MNWFTVRPGSYGKSDQVIIVLGFGASCVHLSETNNFIFALLNGNRKSKRGERIFYIDKVLVNCFSHAIPLETNWCLTSWSRKNCNPTFA